MSLSMILPLKLWTNGFASYEDSETTPAIKQNLKMLLLTNPGEYSMDPNFGVGMMKFLFSQESASALSRIRSKIISQARQYMPYIAITEITFGTDNMENNSLDVSIEFLIHESELPEVFNLNVSL